MFENLNHSHHQEMKDDEYDFEADNSISSFPLLGELDNSSQYVDVNFKTSNMMSRLSTEDSKSINETRPMTAVSGAGYQSQAHGEDILDYKHSRVHSLHSREDESPAKLAKKLEKNIHRLIEESAILMEKRKFFLSLEKAKEAVKRDNALQKHRESHSLLQDQLGDLTYTVWFHLALVYETNRMYQESIEAYSFLLRQKMSLVYVGRIRANMGNIFFCQQNYTEAVKMYRMALDQTPRENVGLIQNIYRSIANSFFRLGKLRDAIRNYEAASNSSADIKTYFNLLLCCVKVGDNKKSKEMLQKIMTTISSSVKSQSTLLSLEEEKTSAEPDLGFELDKERKDEESLVVIAARLLSTLFVGEELVELFRWILEILGDNCDGIVVQIEIEQAIQHLGRNEFFTAINILKCYESSDDNTNDAISTNLSFIYFLQGNYDAAEESANVALSLNRYNHNALVNKGNCCFVQKDFTRAQNFYLEAMKVDCNSIEAIYNLGIASIRLNLIEDAREAFDKLHSILPHDPRVLYQIASLHEVKKELKLSKKWFNVLSTSISTDANVLSRLGQIYCEEDDESQSVHFYLESYRCYPSNLDTIGWLAVWFVKNGMYEKSIQFFEYASRIQPNIHKWHLMIASCYRKTGKDKKAISIYEKIHADDPENLECIRALISVCKDVGVPSATYEIQLDQLTRDSQVPVPVERLQH